MNQPESTAANPVRRSRRRWFQAHSVRPFSRMASSRRWLQFSLRGFLVLLTVSAAGLGWYVKTVWPQQRAVNAILQAGGSVTYNVPLEQVGMGCFFRFRAVDGDGSHFWLDCRHHVLTAYAYEGSNSRELCRCLADLPRAHTLGLSGMRLNDEDLESISKMRELFDLDLAQTVVTDEGIQRLAFASKLELLELPATISDAAVQQLQKALPKCHIFRAKAKQAP